MNIDHCSKYTPLYTHKAFQYNEMYTEFFYCNTNVVANSCNILSSVNISPANNTTAATINILPIAISVSNKVFIFVVPVLFVDDLAGRSIDLATTDNLSSSRCNEDERDDVVISPGILSTVEVELSSFCVT